MAYYWKYENPHSARDRREWVCVSLDKYSHEEHVPRNILEQLDIPCDDEFEVISAYNIDPWFSIIESFIWFDDAMVRSTVLVKLISHAAVSNFRLTPTNEYDTSFLSMIKKKENSIKHDKKK
jgi:hypothetical protein